jgi:transposase-like protein
MIYSKEFRREVLAACDAKLGTRKVALKFNVSESWVRRIKQERREQGKLGPATSDGERRSGSPRPTPFRRRSPSNPI